MQASCPPYTTALLRHFVDLRDRSHHGVTSRADKERLFATAVASIDPHARQTLEEINTCLLLGTGEITATAIRRSPDADVDAKWALSWPQQQRAGIDPILIHAFFGSGFLHSHLRSGTAGGRTARPPRDRVDRHPQPRLPSLGRRAHYSGGSLVLRMVSEL